MLGARAQAGAAVSHDPRDPPEGDSAPSEPASRTWHVLGILALGGSIAGFFTGIAKEGEPAVVRTTEAPAASAPAPGYPDLRVTRRGPNANLYVNAFERFETQLPKVTDPVPPQTAEERARVLEARSSLRAYDGAPPIIPHAVAGSSTTECLACHEKGAIVAGRRAPAMSHPRFESCTQCHAAASGPPSPPPPPLTGSTFVGASPAASGERAWKGAPPTIPHATRMRSECGSCHGVAGSLGMRSTHPWRESCTQCHTPSAALDQRTPRGPGQPAPAAPVANGATP